MKKLFNTTYDPLQLDLVIFFTRIIIACLMMPHGLPKFSKMMDGNFQFADPIGLGEKTSLIMVVLCEVGCSVLLILGLASRFALFGLVFTMCVIVFITHSSDPIGDKETPILYLIAFVIFFVSGPGKFSLDYLISKKLNKE